MAEKSNPRGPAANDKQPQKDKPWTGQPRGYINADITRAEREDFLRWWDLNRGQDAWDIMCRMLDDGYRISCSENDKGFKASCTNVDGPPESRGMCLVGYGSDAEKSLGSLLYKHVVKLNRDWGSGDAEEDTYFR